MTYSITNSNLFFWNSARSLFKIKFLNDQSSEKSKDIVKSCYTRLIRMYEDRLRGYSERGTFTEEDRQRTMRLTSLILELKEALVILEKE